MSKPSRQHRAPKRPDFAYYEALKRQIPAGLNSAEYDQSIREAARKAGI